MYGFCRNVASQTFSELMHKTKTQNSTGILIIIIAILTFPIWIGLIGGLFGLVIGGIGGMIGLVAGAFGIVIGAIGSLVGGIFSWGHWGFDFGGGKFVVIMLVVLLIALAIRPRKK